MEILGSMRLRCFAVTLLMYICNSGIFLCNLSTFDILFISIFLQSESLIKGFGKYKIVKLWLKKF